MNHNRPFPNSNIFAKIDTEEKAYWLGFLYADGCIHTPENYNYRIEVGLAEKDYNHLVKWKNFIGLDNKISYRSKTKSYRYCFRNKEVHTDLIKLGCTPNKSLTLTFPSSDIVPDNLIHHFMRGYLEGDGYILNPDTGKLSVGFIGTQNFIEGAINKFDLPHNKIFSVHNGPQKRFSFAAKKDLINFLSCLYSDATIYLDRKYELYLRYKELLPIDLGN